MHATPQEPDGDDAKKELQELGIETSAFEALERDFQSVLQELVGDKSLQRFKIEFEKLHRHLQKSHASEKRLIAKCRTLNAEIVTNSAKVQQALKMSQDDQKTIAQLKKEIDTAWAMVEVANEKERKAKETINSLREAIEKLKGLVEQGAGFSIGQENSVNELFRVKEELQREVEDHVTKINQLRVEINAEKERSAMLLSEKTAAEQQILMLQDAIRSRVIEYGRESAEKQKLVRELDDSRTELAHVQKLLGDKEAELKQVQDRLQYTIAECDDHRKTSTGLRMQLAQVQADETAAKDQLERERKTTFQLQSNAKDHEYHLQHAQEEIEKVQAAVREEQRKHAVTIDKIAQLKADKLRVEAEKANLAAEIAEKDDALAREHVAKKELERRLASTESSVNKLEKAKEQERSRTDAQRDVVRKLGDEHKVLETHINKYKDTAQDARKQIHDLGKRNDKLKALSMELTTKLLQTQEELKIKDLVIFDKKKKLRDAKVKNKQQQMLYEAVRSDRNLYSKQLIEAQDDIAEFKRKFDILNHQIDQLKQEIIVKEQAIFTEHMTHMRVQKDFAAKQIQLSVLGNQIHEAREFQQAQEEEITKLKHIINEADAERMRQKKALEAARNERDILGTQLIRRNDELALLYEKINIQKYTLEKGEKQYAERMAEIAGLKRKSKELERQLKTLEGQADHVDQLKNAVYQLQRELLQERNRVKALSEELENPMNIHRWRKLEGTDPDKYDLIQKVQTLQKRLIAKTEEVVEKELLIQQKEKYYVELKAILARQPGPEVAEQLNVYAAAVKEKTRQLKAMASELNMFQAQVNEFRFENDRLTRELAALKKKYFAIKKREHARAQDERADGDPLAANAASAPIPTISDPDTRRFAGGGFAIS